MTTLLRRYVLPVTPSVLPGLLTDSGVVATESVGHDVNLEEFGTTFRRLMDERADNRASWDAALAEPLHKAFRGRVLHRITVDMRVWQWLCIVELRDFVWERWTGGIHGDPRQPLTRSVAERFLGARTLRGISRNALARLYWCAETLYSEDVGYSLVRQVLENQDFFQAIFEREFGLYPPAARACVSTLHDASQDEWREATKRLNHVLTTIALETLREDDIRYLLTQ